MKTRTLSLAATLLLAAPASGQVPNTVFLDELTWVEVADKIDAGTTTIIVATAGTEQNGPHMVLGKHKFIVTETAERIARALGNALVAPIVTYVPEGTVEETEGKPAACRDDHTTERALHEAARVYRAEPCGRRFYRHRLHWRQWGKPEGDGDRRVSAE